MILESMSVLQTFQDKNRPKMSNHSKNPVVFNVNSSTNLKARKSYLKLKYVQGTRLPDYNATLRFLLV